MNEHMNRATRFSVGSHESDDAWVHASNCKSWDSHYQQLTSATFQGRLTEAWLGPVQVFNEKINSPFSYHGRSWKGSRVFFSSFPESGSLYYNNRALPAESFTTHRWDSLDHMSCSGGYQAVFVALDEEFFQRYTERVVGEPLMPDHADAIVSSTDPVVAASFRRSVSQVLLDLTTTPEVLASEHGRREIQDRVLGLLIEALEGARATAMRLPHPTTRAYIVDKAMQFIESRLAEPIVLADICGAVRVSPRTLRYSFEEVLGVSPTRYLLSRRLNQVRRELSACSHHAMIEEIAVRWGFWHMGRFAQFYRESFGERPSETRRRVLASA